MKPLMQKCKKVPFSEIEDSLNKAYDGDYSKVFKYVDPVPLGTASLAQVHKGILQTGEIVAIKVQHSNLFKESKGDIALIKKATEIGEKLFVGFKYKWLGYQFEVNLLKELDFRNEGKNAEKLSQIFANDKQIVIPKIYWKYSSKRILVMDFEEGGSIEDPDYLKNNKIDVKEVAGLLTNCFNQQIFKYGVVHADPHSGNIYVRKTKEKGYIEMIILDHGLYRMLDDEFRYHYSNFWRGAITQNEDLIRDSCKKLNIDYYELFVSIVMNKRYDAIMNIDSKFSSEKRFSELKTHEEKNEIRQYAQIYQKDITMVLSDVREEMLLLLKINEFLRAIDRNLGCPLSNFENMVRILVNYNIKSLFRWT